MEHYRRAAIWLWATLLLCVASDGVAQQKQAASRAPSSRDGLILLKNGGILVGDVTKAGDYYLLTKGDDSELRLPVADVELACRDLDAAYLYKRDLVKAGSAREHLLLAQWCLRHDLSARAADQILAAWAIEPNHPAIASLEKRLAVAAAPLEAPQAAPAVSSSDAAQFASLTEIEETLATLTPQAVEQFTVEIQPLLLNRCGNATCHGQASTSAFHLDRPAGRESMTRRLTQRNLFAALQQLDRRFPENSPLLAAAAAAHGGAAEPAVGKLDSRIARQLTAWVSKAALGEQTPLPLSHRPGDMDAFSTGKDVTRSQVIAASIDSALDDKPFAASAVFEEEIADESTEVRDAFRPRDEFDPEIFNRRYRSR